MSLDFRTKTDINLSIIRLTELFNSNILIENEHGICKNSVFIEVLILLRDLLRKSEKYCDTRIDFTDDIIKTDKIKDVSDLIKDYRDSVCHIESKERNLSKDVVISFCEIHGKGTAINFNGHPIENKYHDDIAYIMGDKILYFKRHLVRAFNELFTVFSSHNILYKNSQ